MEKKEDSDPNFGLFVLRMNLSSDSEADLEEERENKMVDEPKIEPMDEAEVPQQHEPQNDNRTHGTSSKAVAKRRSYKKKRIKWGASDEIVMCSAVVDGIKCGLKGVRSAADAIHVKKSEGFWDEVNKQLKKETGKCVSRVKLYYKFRDTRRRFLDNKRDPNPQLSQHEKEIFRILAQAFGNSKRKKRGLSDSVHSDVKGDTDENDGVLEGKLMFPEKRPAKCMSKSHSYHHCASCSSTILRTPRQLDDGTCLINNGGDGRGILLPDIGSNRKEVGLDSSTIGSSGKRLKWDLKDDIVIASVVRDSVNCGLRGVRSAKDVTRFKTHKGFWDEVAEKLKEETGKCVSPWKFCTKFRSMKIRYLAQKQSHVQQLNKHDEELFGILDEMFGNVRKQRLRHLGSPNSAEKGEISGGTIFSKRKSQKPLTPAHSSHLSTGSDLRNQNKRKKLEISWNERFLMGERTPNQDDGVCLKNNGGGGNRNEEVGLDSRSSVKRLKWDLKDEIVISSFVRDGVNCGLDGVRSATDASHFKSHKGFWDEVAEKLNKETGQCASALKLFTKFRSIKNKYLVGKQGCVQQLNQHDKELFGMLDQMFGNDGKQRSGHDGSPSLVDTVLSTERKSLELSTAAHLSHPSTGYDLGNLNEVSPALNWNERLPGDKTPKQEDGKRADGQNEDQKSGRKANLDNLVLRSGVKTVNRRVKRAKWELRDEITIASAVQDGINCGVNGVTSLRDVMSFCKHEGFWAELAKKLKEELGRYISTDKLYQKFRNLKYRYLAIKQSDIQEFNKHDKELFTVLEQVFGNGSCVTPHSDIKRPELSGPRPSSGNGIQEKLYKQSGVSATEDEPQLVHEKAIGQDSQTCNQLPFEVLSTDVASMGAQIKQQKEVESCSNVVNGSTLLVSSLSPGNPSPCEGCQTGVTFTASTVHGVENHNGMKGKEHAGGKDEQLHDRISTLLNETEQDHEQSLHGMLSKSERSGEWKGGQLVTDDILTGSGIPAEPSDHQSDYAEVVKRLERKSRKLQLMQELYKIQQQEIEDHISQVKLKASGNP